MPASFLTAAQRDSYGCYAAVPTPDELARFFHLNDDDLAQVGLCRGDHNRLGFALQLTTVRFLGTFLTDPLAVPLPVLQFVARQLDVNDTEGLASYRTGEQHWDHANRIRTYYGYSDISEPRVGFRLSRWLYGLCWTGTERPTVLFERVVGWLLTHKVLLPGHSTLERFVLRTQARAEERLWRALVRGLTAAQKTQLNRLLTIPEGSRYSLLDQLRSGPTRISGPALRTAIERLQSVRELGIALPTSTRIPFGRIAALARFASRAKAQAISRMPAARRVATLVAFVHCLEATAQDDAIEVLETLLHDLFSNAIKADRKARLRTLKDLDASASTLALACRPLLDTAVSDDAVRGQVFAQIPREMLEHALENVTALIRPPDDVYYLALAERYRSVRGYLPAVLKHLRFEAGPTGKAVVEAFDWLRDNHQRRKPTGEAPREIIGKAWCRHVLLEDGGIDFRAYTFCLLEQMKTALHRRDIFAKPSWRYADPRANLLADAEWEAMRPIVCRTLGLPPDPKNLLDALTGELDRTYREVAQRLPNNPAVRFETVDGKEELILTPLDRLDEPPSLLQLRAEVSARLPRIDLPELLLEIAIKTNLADAFTHLTERKARVADLNTSLCAVLMAEACNTGPEPFIRYDIPALRRDRLSWVKQNYLRDDTLTEANARLVAAQNKLALAHVWGGGEVASADGMRLVVPVRTVHAGPNPI